MVNSTIDIEKKSKWTKSQNDAISARGGTLLVSAGAGSGKTSVLVQRVIERITDENNPTDIERLLIVTFTKAAANEMKERISSALLDLMDKFPGNSRIKKQYFMLSCAKISTIHSFCSELIRENFYKLGVHADFRVAESDEITLMMDEAMDSALESMYSKGDEDFYMLSELISSGRDDRDLAEVVRKLYDFVRPHPFFQKWLDEKLGFYKVTSSFEQNNFVKIIIDFSIDSIKTAEKVIIDSIKKIEADIDLKSIYLSTLEDDLDQLKNLSLCLKNNNWEAIKTQLDLFSFSRLKAAKGERDEFLVSQIKNNRKCVKDIINRLSELYSFSRDECLEDLSGSYRMANQLFETVKLFSEKFSQLKGKSKVLDFSDLEHMTLKLLVESTGNGYKKTEEATQISKNFDEIMIDEYQDTNEAQDMIFKAVSNNEGNIFMVGDIKQSIYRFRQAMPEIFSNKKQVYRDYNSDLDNYPSKVNLDKNFRSKKDIIDSVNFMFSLLMSEDMGEIEYTEEEYLKPGIDDNSSLEPDVMIRVLDLSSDDEDMDLVEARYIATMIADMIGSGLEIGSLEERRRVTYSDFCILLRSAKKHAHIFAKELEFLGIPAWSDQTENFFETFEISVLLSFLKIIDNPLQDIPLISVLMSPIYSFSSKDISDIRLINRSEAFYFLIQKYEDENSELAKKCKDFLRDVKIFRMLSATLPSHRLIQEVYDRTNYLEIFSAFKNGELRVSNLRVFLEYARDYEKSGYKGLSSFVRFIDKLKEKKSSLLQSTNISQTSNAVRVMSIHSSKGLEFPICIIANCSRPFNKRRDNIMLHSQLGVGLKLKDSKFIKQYTTISREAIHIQNEKESMSEELRILYVAMTRAKEKLIMITSLEFPEKVLAKLSLGLGNTEKIPSYFIKKSLSFSDWILRCALKHKDGHKLRELAGLDGSIVKNFSGNIDIKIVKEKPEFDTKHDESFKIAESDQKADVDKKIISIIEKRLNFNYKYKGLSDIPAKITASEMSLKSKERYYNKPTKPEFMSGQKMTSADKGTALHIFMENADFDLAYKDISKHIDKLVEKRVLSLEQGNSIDTYAVKNFFESLLFRRIKNSTKVYREFKFTVDIDAKDIGYEIASEIDDEMVVLQGSVDCAFVEDEKLVIVDYKTDKINDLSKLKDDYKIQLEFYKKAMEHCLKIEVKECLIYSFHIGEALTVI